VELLRQVIVLDWRGVWMIRGLTGIAKKGEGEIQGLSAAAAKVCMSPSVVARLIFLDG
jgi:hypothetical protein